MASDAVNHYITRPNKIGRCLFYIVKLQLISQLKSTQLNLNNLRDELGVDAIFTVSPPPPTNFSGAGDF